MPLHTTYRPKTLDDFVGNKALVSSLKSVLREDDPQHTFLITGPAGTGKTTLARIIKEELKCSDMDFYHINAANVRGIDSARIILENMSLYPMNGPVKIYHYEESHQLTGPTQELLLDETEEPPDFVYFIFCTTEPTKLKKSFKRRGWQGETKSLTRGEMTSLIKSVLNKELEDAESFPRDIIDKVVASSEGSSGQALKLLDSVIDMEDLSQAIDMIDGSIKEEASMIDICRTLIDKQMTGSKKWKVIQKLLTNMDTEPEVVRKAILTYLGKVMLNNSSPVLSDMIVLFSDSFIYSYKAGLINSCYMACELES